MRQSKSTKSSTSRKVRPARRMRRKLIAFEPEILEALAILARDRMQDFQELADEAFADLLRKHGRPTSLKDALRASARAKQ